MDKVRSYPKDDCDNYVVRGIHWHSGMNYFAGTIQAIQEVGAGYYSFKNWDYYLFSLEMIEGPAEIDKINTRT